MKIGFVQTDPLFGDVSGNLETVKNLVAGEKADLIVLPELFSTGYQFKDVEEALNLSEPIPDGPTTRFLIDLAKDTGAIFVAGIAERENNSIHNSAVMAGPEGFIGKYKKIHLFDTELDIFEPGKLTPPVFDIGPAKVGIMICFDWRFPETARTLALEGADLIAHPANLVLPHCPQSMITRCLENRVFAVTADRIGNEERVPGQLLKFIGQSQLVDPDGQILYRASVNKEEVKILEIDILKARDKSINKKNNIFTDRRQNLYRLD